MISWIKDVRSMPHENVSITSHDGLTLRAKYYEYKKGEYIKLNGKLDGGKFSVDGKISSQFITGLIFCGLVNPVKVNITTELQSKPYVDITVDVLRKFGCDVDENGKITGLF